MCRKKSPSSFLSPPSFFSASGSFPLPEVNKFREFRMYKFWEFRMYYPGSCSFFANIAKLFHGQIYLRIIASCRLHMYWRSSSWVADNYLAVPRDCSSSRNVMVLVQTYGLYRSHLNHWHQRNTASIMLQTSLARWVTKRNNYWDECIQEMNVAQKHIRYFLASLATVLRVRMWWF